MHFQLNKNTTNNMASSLKMPHSDWWSKITTRPLECCLIHYATMERYEQKVERVAHMDQPPDILFQ